MGSNSFAMLEYLDVSLFTIPSRKIRNAIRWLKLLEDTGIRKLMTNRIKKARY